MAKIEKTRELKKGDILTIESRTHGMVIAIVREDSKWNLELWVPAFNHVKQGFGIKCGSQERFLADDGYETSPEWKARFQSEVKRDTNHMDNELWQNINN